MHIRTLEPADFEAISPVIDEWWGGRPVRGLLPRLFFEHFSPTSFALIDDHSIAGFLVGFRSQTSPSVAYIHFIGVSPVKRGRGFGRMLYQRFFDTVVRFGCIEVRSITSPVNEGSIAFHRQMGFQLLPSATEVNGYPVCVDHAGPGQHRVLFSKQLKEAT
jgi:ribosomal protein S18 acetylase RimI-like enzyme